MLSIPESLKEFDGHFYGFIKIMFTKIFIVQYSGLKESLILSMYSLTSLNKTIKLGLNFNI